MQFLNLTLPSLAENLALDDALLKTADEMALEQRTASELLRVWQTNELGVVVGRSSRTADEVFLDRARKLNIPVMRRCSGGATVVIGPGCLMYTLLIDLRARPALRMLDEVHHYVMDRMLQAIQPILPSVSSSGTCDLVFNNRKFSGNSLKVGRNWTLYHGTVLFDMQLSWLDQLLRHPPREPAYRQGRRHSEFVTNIQVDGPSLIQALRRVWLAEEELEQYPLRLVHELVESRYSQSSWNFQR